MPSANHILVPTKAESKDHITRHDGDTLSMNGRELEVFEQTDEVCLRGFL